MTSLHPDNIQDITRAQTNLSTLRDDLNAAISGAFPTGRRPYNRVRAVFTYWDVDNTKSAESAKELKDLFESYGYACRDAVIPAQLGDPIVPQRFLQQLMVDMGRIGEAGDLTIFYYAGHGVWDQGNKQLQLQ